jgi:hypothetical protein
MLKSLEEERKLLLIKEEEEKHEFIAKLKKERPERLELIEGLKKNNYTYEPCVGLKLSLRKNENYLFEDKSIEFLRAEVKNSIESNRLEEERRRLNEECKLEKKYRLKAFFVCILLPITIGSLTYTDHKLSLHCKSLDNVPEKSWQP